MLTKAEENRFRYKAFKAFYKSGEGLELHQRFARAICLSAQPIQNEGALKKWSDKHLKRSV